MGRNKDNAKRQTEEIRLLKKRIRSLERENGALKKGIQSGRAFPAPEAPIIEPVEDKEILDRQPEPTLLCKCGSRHVKKVELSKRGIKIDYLFCSECGRREPLKKL